MDTRELKTEEDGRTQRLAGEEASRSLPRAGEQTEPWRALALAAVACALGIAAVAFVSFDLGRATRLDAEGFDGFVLLRNLRMAGINWLTVAQDAVNSVNAIAFVPPVLLLAIVASLRRRRLLMVAIPVLLVGSILSSVALKWAVGVHSATVFGVAIVGGPSFPSDHATASMALVLCILLASPRQWGGFVAGLGGLYLLLVGYGSIMLQGHLPSDVVAGYLMACLWGLIAVAGLRAVEARTPSLSSQQERRPRLTPAVALSSVFALAVAWTLLALARGPHQPSPRAFIGSAIGVALVAVLLIYGFERLASDREPLTLSARV